MSFNEHSIKLPSAAAVAFNKRSLKILKNLLTFYMCNKNGRSFYDWNLDREPAVSKSFPFSTSILAALESKDRFRPDFSPKYGADSATSGCVSLL